MNLKSRLVFTVFQIFSVILLLLTFTKQPYSFYQLLRIFLFITSIAGVYYAYNDKDQNWIILWVTILVLFNPILPVRLSKQIWQIIDVGTIIIFIINILKKPVKEKRKIVNHKKSH